MSFGSMLFIWGFLPVSLALYWLSKGKVRAVVLVLLGLLYWAWNDPTHVLFVLGISVLIYLLCKKMDVSEEKERRSYLIAAWTLAIGMLVLAKALPFIKTAEDGASLFALPMGISLISFSLVSYIMDVYRRDVPAASSLLMFFTYIAFFPKLLMGPIEKYRDFEPQMKEEKIFDSELFAHGVVQFVFGLAKKVLIADSLGSIVSVTFGGISSLTRGAAWVGAIAYMLQIYYDFSGYSDMAIGIAAMLGYRLKKNFDLPYCSRSIAEFWRRWHISLGDWFRRYLYIPLGGNRKGTMRTYFNLMMIFLATGIWHGTGLHFLIWGIYNGVLSVIERLGFGAFLKKHNGFALVYTLAATLCGWIIFRCDTMSDAGLYFNKLLLGNGGTVVAGELLSGRMTALMVLGILFAGPLQCLFARYSDVLKKKTYYGTLRVIVTIVLFVFGILAVMSGASTAFIYAQF